MSAGPVRWARLCAPSATETAGTGQLLSRWGVCWLHSLYLVGVPCWLPLLTLITLHGQRF